MNLEWNPYYPYFYFSWEVYNEQGCLLDVIYLCAVLYVMRLDIPQLIEL